MICARLTFVLEKFAPLGIMLVESAEHALSDPVAMSEVQPLALQLNVIVAQFVVSCVLSFVTAFLRASETVAHLVAYLPKHRPKPVSNLALRTPSRAFHPTDCLGRGKHS
jgi:hypothetical protein